MKKTKIIATFGPAVDSVSTVRQLVDSGVNLFRINCSHGIAADFVKAVNTVKEGCKSAPFPVGVLFDLSGPKLRLARFEGKLSLKAGEKLTLTARKTDLSQRIIAVNHPAVIAAIKKGDRIFIDDGNLMFKAIKAERQQVTLETQTGGTVLPSKGINLPDSDIKLATITEKDKEDIKAAIRLKADYIALSFVRSADDILEAKRIIKSFGGDQGVIAKLEKQEALKDLENIMLISDGVMIARGDLGVELPFEELPRLQKEVIALGNRHHKAVIVATQMLESMRFSERATRAEINDVASAVFDFVDAVMLSAETATGKYPVQTVKTMEKVILATEKAAPRPPVKATEYLIRSEITHAIAKAVSDTHDNLISKVIFAFTTSGFTASLISNLFPSQPVVALTSQPRVMNRLSLLRSVYPVLVNQPKSFDDMIKIINEVSRKLRLAAKKDRVIITGGAPFGTTVPTNFMMIYEIGKSV